MDELGKMLRNSSVNNLATAVIFGGATLSFFGSVFGTLVGDLLDTGGTWVWKTFFAELVVYALLVIVAWWVNSMAK